MNIIMEAFESSEENIPIQLFKPKVKPLTFGIKTSLYF